MLTTRGISAINVSLISSQLFFCSQLWFASEPAFVSEKESAKDALTQGHGRTLTTPEFPLGSQLRLYLGEGFVSRLPRYNIFLQHIFRLWLPECQSETVMRFMASILSWVEMMPVMCPKPAGFDKASHTNLRLSGSTASICPHQTAEP